MITFKGELPMDHERSLEHLVELWTQDLINHIPIHPLALTMMRVTSLRGPK